MTDTAGTVSPATVGKSLRNLGRDGKTKIVREPKRYEYLHGTISSRIVGHGGARNNVPKSQGGPTPHCKPRRAKRPVLWQGVQNLEFRQSHP